MARPDLKNVDCKKLYMHARGFYLAEEFLMSIKLDDNPQLALEMSQTAIVLSALNTELFLKCIVCLETELVPQGHYLDRLYSRVSQTTRKRIEHIWDTELVPHREPMWKKIEATFGKGETLKRDLPSALSAASRAFEKIRYSYEEDSTETQFYISDLPRILGRVILEMKPEWGRLQRRVSLVPEPNLSRM
jgi:hypothetical protein